MAKIELNLSPSLEQEIRIAERHVAELKQRQAEEQCAGQKEALERIRQATDYAFEPVYFHEGLRRFSIDCRFGRRMEVEARGPEFVLQIEELSESQVIELLQIVDKMDAR